MNISHLLTCSAVLLSLFIHPAVRANTVQNITVKFNVRAAACVVNGGQTIDVNFKDDVRTDKIDGSYKKTPLNYTLKCSPGLTKLKMSITGNSPAFDKELISTNNPNLGVRFIKQGSALANGAWSSFNWSPGGQPPVVEAVLVKNSAAKLQAGRFEGSATLQVDYD